MKYLGFLLLFSILFTSCSSATPTPASPTSSPIPTTQVITPTVTPTPTSWWEKAVFYEIFVRSYYDTNGDGIGDFNGITEKLDYLQDLGVNALWLMPIHPSPSYHGYDVLTYYNVNSDYGTLSDFVRLVTEAHKRGIRIIIDLVLNHTSDKNPWFVDSNSSLDSSHRDWYIWSDSDPGYSGPLGNAWHRGKFGYYYGIFGSNMPDLNYKNPAVTVEMKNVVKFWLNDIGVDGFRLDAVKYLVEEGQKQENTQSTHDWLKDFYTSYKADKADAYTVGEVYGAGAFIAKTYTGDQMDEIFSFEMAGGFTGSALGGANSGVNSAVQFTLKDLPDGPYATFLTNHDQNRVMSLLNGNMDKARLAAALLLTSPGTPFIYYGEEVGMEGVKPDEEIRRPMQWSGGANAGFTTGTPWEAVGDNYPVSNVAVETADPKSLLMYYRTLIALRSQHPALNGTGIQLIETTNRAVYAALRFSQGEKILVLVNLSKSPVGDYKLGLKSDLLVDGSYKLESLLGAANAVDLTISAGAFANYVPLAELSPFTTYLFQIK